ncbi:hypothetical protein V8G54_017019 [Vigna mungo]|uniref:Uncharacterized protein n=1 Tax=Vigna mungo TaxID=3915 RepID=A0AAQ3RYD6_VIGMU
MFEIPHNLHVLLKVPLSNSHFLQPLHNNSGSILQSSLICSTKRPLPKYFSRSPQQILQVKRIATPLKEKDLIIRIKVPGNYFFRRHISLQHLPSKGISFLLSGPAHKDKNKESCKSNRSSSNNNPKQRRFTVFGRFGM